ncbi:MAG: NAD-dependent epimerase/dehydratase family protein [Candidatus Promineifilaceae bacterium]|nr:NAD-dependent epimerase/dehydratase family protein [Candidatus Promineifilaceae bacterium]
MKAFVTGGTGFIGANLVAGLNRRGIGVRVLHRENSSLEALTSLEFEGVVGDILDESAALAEAMAGCDWLFHVAAVADYWRQGTERLYRVNVEGTRRLLAAAEKAKISRFVFTSSLAAMGLPEKGSEGPPSGPQLLDEQSSFNLAPEAFPYGHSKALAEAAVQEAVAVGLEAIIVNPTVVLGPRDVNLISGSLIVEAARGRLRFAPPGGVNFVAVEDVVAGHIAAAERGRVGERYILGAHNLPYAEAITTICEVVGQPPPQLQIPRWALGPAAAAVAAARAVLGNRVPVDSRQVRMMGAFIYADTEKAVRELNLPQTPFKNAVQQSYSWYNEHGYL